ncbi:MAG TPA: DivIVA domain-containing protein [Acidimicrobiales bacterium]|jgi:DivIVA domain-containing protein|nr:DivIVA domain-containing protein [Acidimicrobiales bacterium]
MPDDRPTISSSRVTAADVARHSFATVRRGFDPQEVRAYLELVARELSAWEQHDEGLRQELADAEERSQHPVIDESTLTAALGQQSGAVLRNAHDEAARITLQAEEAAATAVREAQQHASEALVRAESGAAERIAEAEIAAAAMHQDARQEIAVMLDAARLEGEALVERTREQGRAMIEQAQDARRRILADMARRRRAVTLQIEQFRAARDELAAAVLGVRDTVDRVVGDLVRADDDARAAASDVARRQPSDLPASALTADVDRAVADLEGAAGAIFDVEGLAPLASRPSPPAGEPAGPDDASALDDDASVEDVSDAAGAPGDGATDPGEPTDPGGVAATADPGEPAGPIDAGPIDADEVDADEVDAPADVDAVEDLFARLRAGHPVDPSETASSPASASVAAAAVDATAGVEIDETVVVIDVVEVEAEVETEAAGESEEAGEPEGDADGGTALDPADAAALAARADVLDPIVAKLARRFKRALQDDQNRLLDQLRSRPGNGAGGLPPEDDQRELYVAAASAQLREAAVAGIAFARRQLGSTRGRAPAPDDEMVAKVASGMAGTVVTLLRRRLSDEDAAAVDPVDRVGAAYREWRGGRVERLVGDAALDAFSAGVAAAAGRAGLRWVLAGGGSGCADCDDNALAGVVAKGEEFPTGHHHPPAHVGCRCLVVPTPA